MKPPKKSTMLRRARALYALARDDTADPIVCRIAQGMAIALHWASGRGREEWSRIALDLAEYCRYDIARKAKEPRA